MPTSDPDWSILASENERLMDSRATQVPPGTAPPAPMPAPAARLQWRRQAAPGAKAETADALAGDGTTATGAPGRRASPGLAFVRQVTNGGG